MSHPEAVHISEEKGQGTVTYHGCPRQPLDAQRQSPSCFLARQEMNLPAMLPRHMKDGFVERG
jgi:hypothetical protein